MTEEQSCVSTHAHLQASGATPNWRFPDQQCERAILVALIAGTEDVCEEGKTIQKKRH